MTGVSALSNIRIKRWGALLLAAFVLSLGLASNASQAAHEAGRLVDVIVQGIGGAAEAEAAVESVGGEVTRRLPIVDGVAATVRSDALPALRGTAGVRQVSNDDEIAFEGTGSRANAYVSPPKVVRSDSLWKSKITGKGVTVALLDTGVYAAHPDLVDPDTGVSRVVHCEDFSHETGGQANCADTFGHGTFMAGLIAGNGLSSGGTYKGTAPEAKIVSVKASGYDGSTDVSTILAGIQWVVAHKDVYGIRALNLSLGSDSAQDYRLSPLNYAVERAWSSGIVVIVSAGNSGPDSATMLKPADDPYVVTVGSSNSEGSAHINDDRVPDFSSRGPTRSNGLAKPDIVSPGVHTVSLRSPGSAIDQKYGPTGSAIGSYYFKGSGTSMSTASVTGVVAQILQKNPLLTPNQVKHRLTSTARAIVDTDPLAAGRGLIDAYAAANSLSLAEANQGIEPSTGLGLLQLDRGSIELDVATPAGAIALTGEFKAQTDPALVDLTNPAGLLPWVSLDYTTTGWDATSWRATSWRADDWAATSWRATSWRATTWDATSWRGTAWDDAAWDATSWRAIDWDATSWRATSWRAAWYAVAWD